MNKTKKVGLEDNLRDLEKIIEKLESGELTLDQGLENFEKGVVLYKSCKNILADAEKKIKQLTDSLKEEDI